MQLVFNELSIEPLASTPEQGQKILEKFLIAYSCAVKNGFNRDVSTFIDFGSIEIAHAYHISKWRNDMRTDRELARRFLGLCQKQRVLTSIEDALEIRIDGKDAKGLLFAHEAEEFSISLETHQRWKTLLLKVEIYQLYEDKTEEIIIPNIHDEEQFTEFADLFIKRRQNELIMFDTVDKLLVSIDTLFPSLIFSDEALKQLSVDVERQHVNTIAKKLMLLENYFSQWDGLNFDKLEIPTYITFESKQSLSRFPDDHEFIINGEKILVSYHLRYIGNIQGRIYFEPCQEKKKCYICSLTTKLRTVSNPKLHV